MTGRFLGIALLLVAEPLAAATHPRYLTPVENGTAYVLAEDFVATEKAATFTLRAGTYVTLFESAQGAYLLGAGDCLEMHVVPPRQPENAYTMRFNCGVLLPRVEQEPARFFYIREALPHNSEFGLITNAIIKFGEGNFQYPLSRKSVVDLRSRLSAMPAAE